MKPFSRTFFKLPVTILSALITATALAQNPESVLPKAYKLQFENQWVKVTRVHYDPYEKLPSHQHTLYPAAYVYLNDSGPVVFKHKDLPYGAVTRQPTKARSFRLYQSVKEMHEVENLSELPSDFLRVEFKTEPVNEKALRGRFLSEQPGPTENLEKVQFENEQVRITRLVCRRGKSIEIFATPGVPALLMALTASRVDMKADGKPAKMRLDPGTTIWIEPGQAAQLSPTDADSIELLRFDFKTKPH
jgi:hypothetical protein